VLEYIPETTGFDVEIKYNESGEAAERNVFVDRILSAMMPHSKRNRQMFFSSFDADICTIAHLKQCRWGVLQLSTVLTQSYPDKFVRLDLQETIAHVRQNHLSGYVVSYDNLVAFGALDALLAECRSRQRMIGTYGNMNNQNESIVEQMQAAIGMDFICTDHLYRAETFSRLAEKLEGLAV